MGQEELRRISAEYPAKKKKIVDEMNDLIRKTNPATITHPTGETPTARTCPPTHRIRITLPGPISGGALRTNGALGSGRILNFPPVRLSSWACDFKVLVGYLVGFELLIGQPQAPGQPTHRSKTAR